ncbi:hypothetical protein [Bifidobacterium aquikefiri]|uniref:hypothetical protein n=1 Tax=Bifidobacterium aquikefiri TaxID=1653207 RepID=UPI0039E8A6A3
MKIIYPIKFADVQEGDWVDWDEEGIHYHDQITEVTSLSDGRKTIDTKRLVFIGNSFKFGRAVVSREVDDSYKPKPKVQTEPGFYKHKNGDLWVNIGEYVFCLMERGSYFGNGECPIHISFDEYYAPYTRVKFVDCE